MALEGGTSCRLDPSASQIDQLVVFGGLKELVLLLRRGVCFTPSFQHRPRIISWHPLAQQHTRTIWVQSGESWRFMVTYG